MASGKLNILQFATIVKNGNLAAIEKAIKAHGIPASESKITDYAILKMALKQKWSKIAEMLIKAGCRVKARPSDDGLTPLAMAFENQNKELALLIKKRGATVDVDSRGSSTVLHLAAKIKSLKMLRVALSFDIEVDCCDDSGKTALQILFESHVSPKSKNNVEMLKVLLSHGASVNFVTKDGNNALDYATEIGDKDIIKSVLAKITHRNKEGNGSLHRLLNRNYESEEDFFEITNSLQQREAFFKISESQKMTIQAAAKNKNLNVLKKFLQYQFDVTPQDSRGDTVLHKLLKDSAHLSKNTLFTEIVDSILSKASLENIKNLSGQTVAHLCAENEHYSILKRMLPKLENIDVVDCKGQSLLYILLKNCCEQTHGIVQILLNLEANVDLKDQNGKTPIDLLFTRGNKKLLLALLQHSKNLKHYTVKSKSVLHILNHLKVDSAREELEITKIAAACIKQGLNVDVLDDSSMTPLCVAVVNHSKYMVEFLLANGANANIQISKIAAVDYLVQTPTLPRLNLEIAFMLASKGASTIMSFNSLAILLKRMDNVHEDRSLVVELLKKCDNLNVRDSSRNTILHVLLNSNVNTQDPAIEKAKLDVVRICLLKGVPINAVNKDNQTPLHLANNNKYSLVADFLAQNGASVNV